MLQLYCLDNYNITCTCTVANLKAIGAGLAILGMSGSGIGVGIVFASLLNAFSRRPELKNELFTYAILGFALTEAVALFCLVMSFVILYT